MSKYIDIPCRQVAGRLHVELGRLSGHFPEDRQGDADSESSGEGCSSFRDSMVDDDEFLIPGVASLNQSLSNSIVSRVRGLKIMLMA